MGPVPPGPQLASTLQQRSPIAQMGQLRNPYQHTVPLQTDPTTAPFRPHPYAMQQQAGPSALAATRPPSNPAAQSASAPIPVTDSPRPRKQRKVKTAAPPAPASSSAAIESQQGLVHAAPTSSGYDLPTAASAPAAMESPVSTIKRPRGRPRKAPLAPLDQAVQPMASTSNIDPSLSGPSGLYAPPVDSSSCLLPPTTLKDYVNRLNAHIEHTKVREDGVPDAYLPTGEWSADDKASFYPILSRHGALRPDLIARDTGKSEAQVQQYLSTVQAQVPTDARLHVSGRIGRGEWARGLAPAAREIGEADMREEEAVAAELLKAEEKANDSQKKKGKRKLDEATWASQMDGTKLSTLSALVNSTVPLDPLAGNKAAKLLRDEQSLSALLAVPTEQRTPPQQKEIRRLKDKKTMRMKYRHNKLIAEGMTAEQITARVGPDAIYLARASPQPANVAVVTSAVSADPLKGNKHAKIMRDEARLTALLAIKTPSRDNVTEIRRLTNKKRARQRIRKRKLLEEGMTEEQLETIDVDELFAQRAGICWGEEDVEEKSVVLHGLGEWVSERGLDLWNYEKMIRGLGDLNISFVILDQLRTYLLAFLVPLLYKVIDLAEREGREPNASHVRSSLALSAELLAVSEEAQGEEWETQTTVTDAEEEELDDLLEEVDEMYDRVREAEDGDWDDPFCVEGIRKGGGLEARAKRKEYLVLLYRYAKRQEKRATARQMGAGWSGRFVGNEAESLIGTSEEEDESVGDADSLTGSEASSVESEHGEFDEHDGDDVTDRDD